MHFDLAEENFATANVLLSHTLNLSPGFGTGMVALLRRLGISGMRPRPTRTRTTNDDKASKCQISDAAPPSCEYELLPPRVGMC